MKVFLILQAKTGCISVCALDPERLLFVSGDGDGDVCNMRTKAMCRLLALEIQCFNTVLFYSLKQKGGNVLDVGEEEMSTLQLPF